MAKESVKKTAAKGAPKTPGNSAAPMWIFLCLALAVCVLSVYSFSLGSDGTTLLGAAHLGSLLLAVVSSWRFWNFEGKLGGPFFRNSFLVFLGLLMLFSGYALFGVQYSDGGEVPAVVFSDVFWLISYLLFVVFLFREFYPFFQIHAKKILGPLEWLFWSIFALMAGGALLAIVRKVTAPGTSQITGWILGGYLVADIVIMCFVAGVLFYTWGGSLFWPNIVLMVAFLVATFSDISFYRSLLLGLGDSGRIGTLGWTVAGALISVAKTLKLRVLESA